MRQTGPLALVLAALAGLGACTPESDSAPVDETAQVEAGLGARSLRLLTRREYEASIRDLFVFDDVTPPSDCVGLSDCSFREESCVGGACVTDPCSLVTFVLVAPAGEHGAVSVAGSFNDWSPTAAGWALSYDQTAGAWLLKRELPAGTHSYKLVTDGNNWLPDPENPNSTPDGFGGTNSVLDVGACEPAPESPAPPSFSADFPQESRPEGFAFDNSAQAGLVTAVHAEQYFRAAERIAELALSAPNVLDFEPEGTGDPRLLEVIDRIGRRLYRRPLTQDERVRFEQLLGSASDPRASLARVLRVMLSSPAFLYRSEIGDEIAPGVFALSQHEIATALSFTYAGTTPDDELLDAADAAALDGEDAILAQAQRLLDGPRGREQLRTFAGQWLGIEGVAGMDKGARSDGWNASLSQQMLDETLDFVAEVVLERGDFSALFTSETTVAPEPLSSFYGAADGGLLPEARRAGLLAHGSVLASFAHSNQTSPVRRGLFVRTRLMCLELGPPPANAGAVPEIDESATTRERFAQHAADPVCNSCHQHIDPIGFGFESFDEVGAFRELDAGKPIDTSGSIGYLEGWEDAESSASFTSLPELGAILAETTQVRRCFAEQALRFASGQLTTEADAPAVQALIEQLADADDDPRALWLGLARLPSFTQRRAP